MPPEQGTPEARRRAKKKTLPAQNDYPCVTTLNTGGGGGVDDIWAKPLQGAFFSQTPVRLFRFWVLSKGHVRHRARATKMIGRSDNTATTTARSTASTSFISGTMLYRADLTAELCFFLKCVLKY